LDSTSILNFQEKGLVFLYIWLKWIHITHPNLDLPALDDDPDPIFQNNADPTGSGSTTLLLGRIVQSCCKRNRPEAQVETEFVEVEQLFKVFDDPKKKQV
jgi:hypothetical protein